MDLGWGKKTAPLHGSRIEDYALIGDCRTGALVSVNGSIDWLCWPNFASGACFTALLGTRDHGHWQIAPAEKILCRSRRYQQGTLVLETGFQTDGGEVMLTDFMPPRDDSQTGGSAQKSLGHSQVVRMVTGVRGKVPMRFDLAIRFDYGRTVPWVTKVNHELHAVAGPDMVVLRAHNPGDVAISLEGEGSATVGTFTVRAGATISFTLTYGSSMDEVPEPCDPTAALAATTAFWCRWAARSNYRGDYAEVVERSLMTLKAMTYQPTGGIVAAVTTSLPEQIGGPRNWDYRYCWLRDTSFTLLVLMQAGYTEEAIAWRKWLLRAVAGSPEQIQTIYGIDGERQIPEWTADWLPGYENSSPVRIGNQAVNQFQLDVFGEVVSALAITPQAEDDIRVSARSLQASLVNHLCNVWTEPDEGIWEVRGPRQHFTFSKVMAWVALDRAVRQDERADPECVDLKRWTKNRDLIHKEVCAKGFDKKLNSFTQSYGSRQLDASCLLLGLVGFLPSDDPRIIGTVEAIEKHLMNDGFVQRYDTSKTADGLKGAEGAFLACSFWMVTALWLIGRKEDARTLYERLIAIRNDVGLLSEEYDSSTRRMVGNFPQALSHIALVHAAFAMAGLWVPEHSPADRTKLS